MFLLLPCRSRFVAVVVRVHSSSVPLSFSYQMDKILMDFYYTVQGGGKKEPYSIATNIKKRGVALGFIWHILLFKKTLELA